MGEISARNFGLLIAYLIPGFLALWGLSYSSESIHTWLVGAGSNGPSVGSVFYVVLASIGCGMTASVFRWAILDTALHCTGLKKPILDESKLADRLQAFDYLVENHYRYYQFYGNTLLASFVAFAGWRLSPTSAGVAHGWAECGLFVLAVVFVLGSRDSLSKYYARSSLLLGTVEKEIPHDERQPPAQGPEDEHETGTPRERGEEDRGGGGQ